MTCLGCASGKESAKSPVIKSEWVARLSPEEMKALENEKMGLIRAQDEAKRTQVARQDNERQLDVNGKEEKAARSHRDAQRAALKAAEARGEAKEIAAAQRHLRTAEEELAVADARYKLREKSLDSCKAEEELRNRQVTLAKARLELAQYQALKASNDTRVKDISAAQMRGRVEMAAASVEEQEGLVEQQLKKEKAARASFERKNEALKATGGSGNQGHP